MGGLDSIVVVVGRVMVGLIEIGEFECWWDLMMLNIIVSLVIVCYVVEYLIDNGCRDVILVGFIGVIILILGVGIYGVSKWGLCVVCDIFCLELVSKGINVSFIMFGMFEIEGFVGVVEFDGVMLFLEILMFILSGCFVSF